MKPLLLQFTLICLACLGATTAHAAEQFTLTIEGESASVTLQPTHFQGQPYVSLVEAATGFGGSARVSPVQVQVDLQGATAVMQANERRVSASSAQFELQHPLVLRDENAFIAVADLASFFQNAFALPLAHQSIAAPTASDTEPLEPVENLVDEMPLPAPAQPTGLGTGPIVIDAGHGGSDFGFAGPTGLSEKELTLQIARELQRELQERGFQVAMTRTEDTDVSLKSRGAFANEQKASFLISIHAGASLATRAHGFEIFHPPSPPGQRSSRLLGERRRDIGRESFALASALGEQVANSGTIDLRGIREMPLRLFSDLPVPGILVEVGFLSNSAEETLLTTADYQRKLAFQIAEAIAALNQGAKR